MAAKCKALRQKFDEKWVEIRRIASRSQDDKEGCEYVQQLINTADFMLSSQPKTPLKKTTRRTHRHVEKFPHTTKKEKKLNGKKVEYCLKRI